MWGGLYQSKVVQSSDNAEPVTVSWAVKAHWRKWEAKQRLAQVVWSNRPATTTKTAQVVDADSDNRRMS